MNTLQSLFSVLWQLVCSCFTDDYLIHRRRRRGQRRALAPTKKIGKKYFSGKNHVKFGNFVNCSGTYVNSGILLYIYFLAKMSCPQSWMSPYAYDLIDVFRVICLLYQVSLFIWLSWFRTWNLHNVEYQTYMAFRPSSSHRTSLQPLNKGMLLWPTIHLEFTFYVEY